jgi:hypothetical protein
MPSLPVSSERPLPIEWSFDCHVGRAGLTALLPEWREMASGMAALGFTQVPEWCEVFADHLAADAERLIWISARQDGKLAAVLPLERDAGKGTRWSLFAHPHVALADVAANPGTTDLWRALWSWLQTSELPWVSLHVPRANADAVIGQWITEAPPRMSASIEIDATAWLPCDRDYADLLKAASGNHRSSLSRAGRKAAEAGRAAIRDARRTGGDGRGDDLFSRGGGFRLEGQGRRRRGVRSEDGGLLPGADPAHGRRAVAVSSICCGWANARSARSSGSAPGGRCTCKRSRIWRSWRSSRPGS